jgi:hypothetical protein
VVLWERRKTSLATKFASTVDSAGSPQPSFVVLWKARKTLKLWPFYMIK